MTVEHPGRTNGHVVPQPPASTPAAPATDESRKRAGIGRVLLPALLAITAVFVIRRFAQRADA